MVWKGFIGGSYRDDSLPISAQRSINWYPESQPGSASTPVALRATPGYKEILTIDDPELPGGSFVRGIYTTSKGIGVSPNTTGSIIAVVGPYVYHVHKDVTWQYERLGTISNTISKVSMVDDGFGLVIADGLNLYRMDLQTKVFGNVGFNLQNPTQVSFMGGYTITIGVDTDTAGTPQNTFFWSGLYDNGTWDALSFASAEQSQDPISACIVAGGYLYLVGPQSYELWSPTGDQDLPFQRAYASSGAVGIYAPLSLTKFANSVYMLGTSGGGDVSAYKSNGTEMVKISTPPLERHWQQNITVDCTTWCDSHDGHDFVMFNFDGLDETWVYDIGENEWHQRASRDEDTDTLHRWEPNYVAHLANETIVGDRTNAKFFEISTEYTTENGDNILRIRTTSHQQADLKPFITQAVRMDLETGNGINMEDPTRYTQAPTVMWRYSVDSGRTYSSEIRQTFGRTGDYMSTVEFQRMGIGRRLTGELKISDSVKTSILNAYIYPKVAERTRNG